MTTAVSGAHARSAIELLVDELAQAGSDLDRHGFYSRPAEVACRIGGMARAAIFRFAEPTPSAGAARPHPSRRPRFPGGPAHPETAPASAPARSEDPAI